VLGARCNHGCHGRTHRARTRSTVCGRRMRVMRARACSARLARASLLCAGRIAAESPQPWVGVPLDLALVRHSEKSKIFQRFSLTCCPAPSGLRCAMVTIWTCCAHSARVGRDQPQVMRLIGHGARATRVARAARRWPMAGQRRALPPDASAPSSAPCAADVGHAWR
jgi:hypothetical protein